MTEFKDIHGRAITVAILFVCLFAVSAHGEVLMQVTEDWVEEVSSAVSPLLKLSSNPTQSVGGDIYINDKKELVVNMQGKEEIVLVFDNLDDWNFHTEVIEREYNLSSFAGPPIINPTIKKLKLKFKRGKSNPIKNLL